MSLVFRLIRNTLQRSRLSLLSILIVMVCSFPVWGASVCSDFVVDGSFPDSNAPLFSTWNQISSYSIMCDKATCLPTDPNIPFDKTIGPHSDSWWAWFEPSIMPEIASLERNITIPVGIAQLQFYLRNMSPFGSVTEVLNVRIDNGPQPLFSTSATDTTYNAAGYTLVTLDLSPYADGSSHNLIFEAQIEFNANFHIDDIARAPNETFINYNPASKTIIRKNNLLQPVIDNTLSSQEIRGQSITNKIDDILINLSSAAALLTIRGGFDCDLGDNTGGNPSSVRSLTISSGHVVAENMATWGGTVVPGLVVKGDGRFVAKNVVLR